MNGPKSPAAAPLPRPDWMEFLDEEEWRAFSDIIISAEAAGIDLLIGGALGLSAYMPLRRRTKDIDFYVLPSDRDRMARMLESLGFHDLYEQLPYDRAWIYRSLRNGVIADVIWSFANQRATVDPQWFQYSRKLKCGASMLSVVPPEELLWGKLFVLQRERCDWPDLLNLLYYAGPTLDWNRLRLRVGPDQPLLDGLLSVFSWLCPGHPVAASGERSPGRSRHAEWASLLDSRPWFLPAMMAPEENAQ